MSSPISRKFLCISLILSASLLLGCTGFDRDQFKKLMAEGDALIESGADTSQEGAKKLNENLNDATIRNFPSNREQLRGGLQQAADLYAKAATAYRDASSKYEEAGKLNNAPDVLKEYISLKVQGNRKRADALEKNKEISLLALDPSVNDSSTLITRFKEAQAQRDASSKEADALHERANKMPQGNQ